MTQTLVFGFGALHRLPRLLDRAGSRRVFLVTGRRSFESCGAAATLGPLLAGRVAHRFRDVEENPKIEDVIRGIAAFRSAGADAVVAVGGGSALDTAKLVNTMAHQDADPLDIVRGDARILREGVPLFAVPTTSGSGSEATHFAVVYVDRSKYSVGADTLLPSVAIVDPGLTCSMSPALTAASGIDAFSQAVESYWSVHSTEASKACARRAIELTLRHLADAVSSPTRHARRAMSKAAHLAGRAINVTKTTGAHAVSYALTAYFGIPHGHAAGLTLGRWLLYNSEVTDADVADPRGAGYVRRTMEELVGMMGCTSAEQCCGRIEGLMESLGLATRLRALGISKADALAVVVPNVNAERLVNNPRAATAGCIGQMIEAVC